MIEAEDLHKTFAAKAGPVKAVDGVSFVARDGEITGLLGPNGSGKTTTMRMLYAAMAPERGRVRVDGVDAAERPAEVRRRLGVLPDARGVYKRLTARENVAYFGRLCGLGAAEVDARARALCDALGMADFFDRRAEGFSQGQRTKTALARALVHDPKNVVLDEPTNGLDVMATRSLRELIRRLKEQGHCVLFSSHVMQEVAMLCDEIVIIAHGRVVAVGSPDAIRAQTGVADLEDAFVKAIGGEEGLVR
jgi:sodium transport system ATP-binding protein